ncbi:FKBP-type peptidyl-prolyl cis-trans isomerase [Hymenobacter swuensis]|uniref:Peptidyl-prolyl cis-trans isomerase n=1 Tax=Hymenobacter swuensis DY53 TaxID=1227739 RepID=W8EUB6_9BACT|nr:FKBP-type peptidyl-prolyl cis-trans isomerase [Hymenobacter swuensis]AHJ96103.1 peptidylprolyl isomerase [Hymenobacter swuensis DY53]
MLFSLFRRSGSWLVLCLLVLGNLVSACQKTDIPEDNTDYVQRDEDLIKAYIKDNGLAGFQRQPSGLYVAITQPGTGALPTSGQNVSALYTGLTLDNRVFDSATNPNQPFSFPLGQGKVIQGWDLGFALLPVGSKAILLIPSGLAYGKMAVGPLPAHSVLRFDVEVLKVQ